MRMNTLGQLLHALVHGNQHSNGLDSAGGMVPHYLHAEDLHLVIIGGKEFYESLGVSLRDGTGNGTVLKCDYFIVDSFFLCLRFIQPHARHFRTEEHDGADILIHQLAFGMTKDPLHGVPAFQLSYIHQ